MEQNKQEREQPKELNPEQIQRRKKLIVFPLMFAGFALVMYFIFMPSKDDKQEQKGLNTDLPIPKNEIIGDKKTAYEMELLSKNRKDRKLLSLKDFGLESDTVKNKTIVRSIQGSKPNKTPKSSIRSSADAYKNMNRDLNSFYNQPHKGSKEKELERKIEKLQAALDEKNSNDNLVDEQLKVMEESYKMAAKYMPSMQGQAQKTLPPNISLPNVPKNESRELHTVSKLSNQGSASALSQTISDSAFMDRYSQPHNIGFHTAGLNEDEHIQKNTIKACVHNDQIIISGQNVKLRLLEPIKAGDLNIPRHEIIIGIASVQGERLNILVKSIEYSGKIIPVEMLVYDMDGQQGIFVPGSMERNAAKEIVAGMGSSSGTSISVNGQSAAGQLAVDMGRNIMQGGSQYLSKRLQLVRIKLKAGHSLLLLPKQE